MGRNSAVSERSMWALGDDINRPCGTRLELIALSTNCSNRNTVSYLESPFHCSEFWYGLSREQALSLFCLENVYTWYGVERRTANTSGCLSVCISYPLHAENDSRNLWPYRTPEHQLNGLKWPTSLYYACVWICVLGVSCISADNNVTHSKLLSIQVCSGRRLTYLQIVQYVWQRLLLLVPSPMCIFHSDSSAFQFSHTMCDQCSMTREVLNEMKMSLIDQ